MSAVTPTHQRVQVAPGSGINLSAGLKNRLKRCGRYHSATPSAKKPCIAVSWSPEIQQASSVVLPVTPQDISRGDNSKLSNTPKALPSCSRRMRTSLSFKSPVMKSMSYGPGPPESIVTAASPQRSETSNDESCSGMDPRTPLSSKHKRLTQNGNKNRLKFSSDLDKVDQQSTDFHYETGLHSVHNDEKTGQQSAACSDNSVQQSVACCDKASIQSLASSHKSVPQSVGCCDKTSLQSPGCSDMASMRKEKRDLMLHLTAAEEKLRKLNMVKIYRSKNNLQQLQSLIDKWRGVTQQALSDLHNMLPQPHPLLPDLVKHLQIDTDLVQLDLEETSEA